MDLGRRILSQLISANPLRRSGSSSGLQPAFLNLLKSGHKYMSPKRMPPDEGRPGQIHKMQLTRSGPKRQGAEGGRGENGGEIHAKDN